jgi:hypothetical protein
VDATCSHCVLPPMRNPAYLSASLTAGALQRLLSRMAGQCSQPSTDGSLVDVDVEGVLECRDGPVELAFEEWRNTLQPDHDIAAPHDVGAPSRDSPRLKENRLPLPSTKSRIAKPLL